MKLRSELANLTKSSAGSTSQEVKNSKETATFDVDKESKKTYATMAYPNLFSKSNAMPDRKFNLVIVVYVPRSTSECITEHSVRDCF